MIRIAALLLALVGCSSPRPARRQAAPALTSAAPAPPARRPRRARHRMVRLPYVLVIPVAEGRKTVWAGADLNGIARSLFERHLRAGEKALARGRSSVALRYAEEVLEGMKTTKRAHAHLERAAVELQRRARKVLGVRLHDLAPDR